MSTTTPDMVSITREELKRLLDLRDVLADIAATAQSAMDDAPGRPGDTCPKIDGVIKITTQAAREVHQATKIIKDAGEDDPFSYRMARDLEDAEDALEELRSANSALRENGRHLFHQLREIATLAVAATEEAQADA